MSNPRTVEERIWLARIAPPYMSAETLGDIVGIPPGLLESIERGHFYVDWLHNLGALQRIAGALGKPVDRLMTPELRAAVARGEGRQGTVPELLMQINNTLIGALNEQLAEAGQEAHS